MYNCHLFMRVYVPGTDGLRECQAKVVDQKLYSTKIVQYKNCTVQKLISTKIVQYKN